MRCRQLLNGHPGVRVAGIGETTGQANDWSNAQKASFLNKRKQTDEGQK